MKDTESRLCSALVSTAVLSYTLGLRHALDADHISVRVHLIILAAKHTHFSSRHKAIDLMTRRLIASGQRPVTVGTFFSLGHSTFVLPRPSISPALLSDLVFLHQNCHSHLCDSRRHGLRYQLQVRRVQSDWRYHWYIHLCWLPHYTWNYEPISSNQTCKNDEKDHRFSAWRRANLGDQRGWMSVPSLSEAVQAY